MHRVSSAESRVSRVIDRAVYAWGAVLNTRYPIFDARCRLAALAALVFLLLAARPAHAQEPFASGQDAVVATVAFTSTGALDELVAHYDVWDVDHSAGTATVLLDGAEIKRLRARGVAVTIDAARTADLLPPPAAASPRVDGRINGFPCYRTLAQTNADLAALVDTYPTLAEWKDIGDTWDKVTAGGPAGNDIQVLVLTNQERPGFKFRFTLMAAIHARELVTAETATRFAEWLVTNYGIDADATWLLDYGELHLIPQANPDGRLIAEKGYSWRKNTHADAVCPGPDKFFSTSYGVDLNRNSSFAWNYCQNEGCSSSNRCVLTYRGESAASEPETQAIEGYIAGLYPDLRAPELDASAPLTTTGLFVSLHSYGEKILYPWGFTEGATPNRDGLAHLGARFAAPTGYDACQTGEPGCLYSVDGATDDWVYGTLGVPALTFEMGTSFFQGCQTFENTINPDVNEALLYGFKAARLPYVIAAGPQPITVTVAPTQVAAGQPITLTVTFRDGLQSGGGITETRILTAAYALSAPVWAGGSPLPLDAADGAFDSEVETAVASIDTTGWRLGRVAVFVEAADGGGTTGVTGSVYVDVVQKTFLPPVQTKPDPLYLPLIGGGTGSP